MPNISVYQLTDTPDISHVDQLTIIVRYLKDDIGNNSRKIHYICRNTFPYCFRLD